MQRHRSRPHQRHRRRDRRRDPHDLARGGARRRGGVRGRAGTVAQSSVQKLAAAERLRARPTPRWRGPPTSRGKRWRKRQRPARPRAAEVKASETTYAGVAAAKRAPRVAAEKELAASLGEVAKLTARARAQESLRRLADSSGHLVEADAGLADALEAAAQQSRDAARGKKRRATRTGAAALAALRRPAASAASQRRSTGLGVGGTPRSASTRRPRRPPTRGRGPRRAWSSASSARYGGWQSATSPRRRPRRPRTTAAPAVEVAAEGGDVGSWLFSKRLRVPRSACGGQQDRCGRAGAGRPPRTGPGAVATAAAAPAGGCARASPARAATRRSGGSAGR